jgi:polysaccharide pyruvyl transferase WcaK-like protein
MKCVLVGNYGVGNLGDELLKEYFLQTFRDVEWVVLNRDVPRLPAGIRSLFTPWWKTIGAIRKADALVFGGGSLFTDIESSFACFLWWMHAWVASLFHTPIILAFQGVGPFRTKTGERFARFVARRAVAISVRDPASHHRVLAWSLNTKVVQSFDPVFSLLSGQKNDVSSKNVFIIIPRKNSGENLENSIREYMNAHGATPCRIVLLEPDDVQEKKYTEQLLTLCPKASIASVRTAADLTGALRDASSVLTERYHGAIAALALGIPVTIVSQGSGDKLDALRLYADGARSLQELAAEVEKGSDSLLQALESIVPKQNS